MNDDNELVSETDVSSVPGGSSDSAVEDRDTQSDLSTDDDQLIVDRDLEASDRVSGSDPVPVDASGDVSGLSGSTESSVTTEAVETSEETELTEASESADATQSTELTETTETTESIELIEESELSTESACTVHVVEVPVTEENLAFHSALLFCVSMIVGLLCYYILSRRWHG